MAIVCPILLIFYVSATFLYAFTYGTCQCNQMLHPGVFSGERMTFAAEGNHDHEKRSDNGGKQSINIGVISFEPPYLDFGEQPIGMPYVHNVVVINPSGEKNLQLKMFSGDNAHFHASFFESKTLLPLSNTTFEVIFLARIFGNVENTLFIHTSRGAYPYQVRGFGIKNPYRLRPFLGARVALDRTFSSVINMYNPHDSMLQVFEIYSSGGDLHLELPTGEDDASHKHWQIAPFETKSIIKLSFLGRVAGNHTSFIRIRTNKFFDPSQFLILPVEVEVLSVPGIFSSIDQIDFGTLRKMDEPKMIIVSLMNTGNKPVTLTDVSVDPPNKAVSIELKTSVIKHSHQYIKAFTVTYSASNVKSRKQHLGKIVIASTSKNTPRLQIAYQVDVLQGALAYSVSKTRFFIGLPPYEPVVREIVITNTFTFPLVIYRVLVSSDVQESLSIVNFSSPITIQEQKTITPFSIRFVVNKTMSTFSSSIRVYTNASIFTVPVHCYDGKLQFLLDESVLEFGTLAVMQKHHKVFEVANPNPVEVTIKQTTSNASLARIKLINIKREDDSKAVDIAEEGFTIKPGRVVKLRLDISAPEEEGSYTGNITFNTAYESKAIEFSLKAASGRVEVDPVKIIFDPSFPGRIQKTSLFLKSTFIYPVNVVSAVVEPENKYFSFTSIKKSKAQLAPYYRQKIGDVIFNPGLHCYPECYLGTGSENKSWFASLSLPSDTARIDTSILETSQTEWNSVTNAGKTSLSSSLVIDTEAVHGVKASIEGSLVWPSLTSDRPVRFPLTHVGNVSRKTLMLENPSDVPVVAQIVPLSIYPKAQSVLDVLSDRFDVDLLTAKPSYHSCFSLPTTETNRHLSSEPIFDDTSSLEAKLGVRTSPDVISLVIAPRSKAKVSVQFKPENEEQRTSVILIRNNLTVLDVVTVQGQGARGELMINGKSPSVDSVLLFELKQRHLADCSRMNHGSIGKPYRALTVKKTVLATNPGQLATQVTSFSIDGYECEGYGFKVLNCQSLNLKPTTSVKIDITFTPDFSVSRVSRRLQIKTALGSVFEFSLIATIPSELMPLCANAAGRPVWEFHVYVSAIAVMICLLMVVLVMARFEANKLVAKSLATLHSNTTLLNGSHINGELFDLRKITAPSQTPTVSNNPCQPRQENGSMNVQCSRTEVTTHTSMYSQTSRRNSSDSYERFVSNNNSISPKTSEDEHNRGKGKSNEGFIKDSSKKQKRGNSGSRTPKRRDSGSEASKPVPLCNSAVALEAIADEVFQSHLPNNGGTSPTFSRGSSSSETNSVCSDVPTIATKKEKPKGRKKTAKVFPVVIPVDEKKSKAGDKEKVKSAEKAKENEKSKEKEKEKEKERNNTSEKRKDKRNKHDVEIKEHSKESRKHEGQFKTPKFENDKVSRRVSLPVELEHTNSKPKEDKPKSHQSLVTSTAGKNQGNSSRSVTSGSSKKAKAVHSNSLPTVTRARKQTSEPREFSNEVLAPHTITEAINSALERTLKHSPTSDTGNQKSSPHNLSRCSSLSPSPSPSDLSPNLSQSSRSSSYSSVVGSEESGSGSSEHSGKRKKARKPSPLTIQKKTGTSNPFEAKTLINTRSTNGLTNKPWSGIWVSSPCGAKEEPTMESFSSTSTSSSLFASTPFDKDSKLENKKSTSSAQFTDDPHYCGDKFPLFTFHDVKAPGLSTPFVETDSSVPKFWPDEPIPSLETLIPNVKQSRSTNWVNFLDESSSSATNLPSPGMPQSTKTVAEIWDAGQSHDDNDGWSAAFSPSLDSELSPQEFSPFHQPYACAWSTGSYQQDFYGMSTENGWTDAGSDPEAGFCYAANETSQYSSASQLNPYSEPWNASGLANQNPWSSTPSYHE